MSVVSEGIWIDEKINDALALCCTLSAEYAQSVIRIEELYDRLSKGRLHLAVLGQFNRGKSTFINALLGRKILPVSVLPLTSVPTIIRYGSGCAAIVRFTDGAAPEYRCDGGDDAIENTLREYVTEERNPANCRGVREVVVECPGDILLHGTTLVDTPGFGSTFTHNTETTIGFLSRCDAALFLLSADLPITQAEIEFLGQVRAHVPRIFFIYNKIDLLSGNELEKTSEFIGQELNRHFGFPRATRLYAVCALASLRNIGNEMQDTVDESGIDTVRRDIVEFLLREKYFALSHALTGKLREAIVSVSDKLRLSYERLSAPITDRTEKLEACRAQRDAVLRGIDDACRFSGRDRESIDRGIRMFVETAIRDLHARAGVFLDNLLEKPLAVSRAIEAAGNAFPQLLAEMAARVCAEAKSRVPALLHEPAAALRDNLARAACRTAGLSGDTEEIALPSVTVAFEPEQGWVFPDIASRFSMLKPSFSDRFAGGEAAARRIREKISPVLEELVDTVASRLLDHFRVVSQKTVSMYEDGLRENYAVIITAFERVIARQQQELEAMRASTQGERDTISDLIARFDELAAGLP